MAATNLNFTESSGKYIASFESSGTMTAIQINREMEGVIYVEVSANDGSNKVVVEPPRRNKDCMFMVNLPEGCKIYVTSLIPVTYASYTASEIMFYPKDETYNKSEVYNKSETYSKTEVYNKTEVYAKSETYSKTQVDTMIAGVYALEPVPAQTLPEASASTMKKLYLIPKPGDETGNIKEEWITYKKSSNPDVYDWEKIGDTDYTNKADKVVGATPGNLAGLDANGNLTDSGKNPSDFQETIEDLDAIREGASLGATAMQEQDIAGKADVSKLLSGELIPAMANDLLPKTNNVQQAQGVFAIRPTGGDIDVKTGDGVLYEIRGRLDSQLNPFNGDTLVCTGENLINPEAYANGIISNNTIAAGNNLIVKFPVAVGTWGEYQTTQANNGYIIKGAAPVAVRQYAHKAAPVAGDALLTVSTHIEDGKTFYLPFSGWMVLEFEAGTDLSNVSCHLAWSNSHDDNLAEFDNFSLDISAAKNWIHTWGMAALSGAERRVLDKIVIAGNVTTSYRYTDRLALDSAGWSVSSHTENAGEEDEVTIYTFTYTLGTMAVDGLWASKYDGITVDGNTLMIVSTSISTVAALQAALSGYYFYYELATMASTTTVALSKDIMVNDYGLEYFLESGAISDVPADVVIGYHQNVKDQLLNNVTYTKQMAEVVAASLCELNGRVSAMEELLTSGNGTVTFKKLTVTRSAILPA